MIVHELLEWTVTKVKKLETEIRYQCRARGCVLQRERRERERETTSFD